MSSNFPLNKDQLTNLVKDFPTPFYLYDEQAIRENMKKFTKAFSEYNGFEKGLMKTLCNKRTYRSCWSRCSRPSAIDYT